MPQNMQIALFVLGAVLILIGIVGGNIKIFGAEIAEKVSNPFIKFISLALGGLFIWLALHLPNSVENKIVVDPSLPLPSPVSGVSIKKNDLVEITTARDFQWACKGDAATNRYVWVGPGGDSSFRSDQRSTLPDAPFCSLIGRVGTGSWHYLGDSNILTADSSGGLYLTANDVTPGNCPLPNKQECYSDNKGTASATVTVNVRKSE